MKRCHDVALPEILGQAYFLLIIVQMAMSDIVLVFMFSFDASGPLYNYLVAQGTMRTVTYWLASSAGILFLLNAVMTLYLLFTQSNENQ